MLAGVPRSRRAPLVALLLTLCALFVFLPGAVSADGSFLYGRFAVSEPTRLDLSELVAGRRYYIFPRELAGSDRSFTFGLRPRRVLILLPSSPTIVVEICADKSLDELSDESLKRLRETMAQMNRTKNRLAALEARCEKLKASLGQRADSLAKVQPASGDGDDAALREAYRQLAQGLRDFKLCARELSPHRIQLQRQQLSYQLERLRLAVLLNRAESGGDHSVLTVRSPEELVRQLQERIRRQKEQQTRHLDAVTRRLAELTSWRGSLIDEAFDFSQPVEAGVLVSALANRIEGFQPAAFAHPREFVALVHNERELAELAQEQRVLNAALVDDGTMEALLRGEASGLAQLPVAVVRMQALRVPASMEGITRRLARDSAGWSQVQWASFLSGLARSFADRGLARVPVPPRSGAFSGPDYLNLSRMEVPALLAALEGLGAGSPSSGSSASSASANPPNSSAAAMTWDALLTLAEDGLATARASAAASSTAASASTFGASGGATASASASLAGAGLAPAATPAELTFWEVCVFLMREGGRGA